MKSNLKLLTVATAMFLHIGPAGARERATEVEYIHSQPRWSGSSPGGSARRPGEESKSGENADMNRTDARSGRNAKRAEEGTDKIYVDPGIEPGIAAGSPYYPMFGDGPLDERKPGCRTDQKSTRGL